MTELGDTLLTHTTPFSVSHLSHTDPSPFHIAVSPIPPFSSDLVPSSTPHHRTYLI